MLTHTANAIFLFGQSVTEAKDGFLAARADSFLHGFLARNASQFGQQSIDGGRFWSRCHDANRVTGFL